MTDLGHYFSGDLGLGATGDLQVVDTLVESQQRILRRLLTNPGDYLWQPEYGAGLPQYIGRTLDEPALAALIRAQMSLEDGVSQDPPPQIAFTVIPNGIFVQIAYTDTEAGPAVLNFDVTS